MYALNRAQLIGYLTETPEIRQTPSGQSVGDLNVMTRHTFTTSSGQSQSGTAYHNVVVWRGLADIAARFLKKGSQVFIAGRIHTDEWADQSTGQKRYKTRITADELILLDPKNEYAPLPANSKLAGSLNHAEVIGNITRDPELRQTPNGDTVVNFSVATNFSWRDRAGEQQEKTEFHNVVVWGEMAREASSHVRKGRKVYVSGRLQTRSWEAPDGQKRYATEIIAESLLALGTFDQDLGRPSAAMAQGNVTFSEPQFKNAAASSRIIPENPVEVPAISYESDIKPEDLPF